MSVPEPRGPRLRDLGLRIGRFVAGPFNGITDVDGVTVGHVTIWRDEPDPPEGRGIARTGVTAVLPAPVDTLHAEPVPAGTAVLNGAGELTGSVLIAEWGRIETPVYLTSTHAVGRVYDGAISVAVAADPAVGAEDFVIPVVGECDDSWLSEGRLVQVEAEDVGRAVESATGGVVADPNSNAARVQEYPFVLIECRGIDSATAPAAQRMSPETCWTQSVQERFQRDLNTGFPAWRVDRRAGAFDRRAVVNAPDPRPSRCGSPAAAEHWLPFSSVTGARYNTNLSLCGRFRNLAEC